MSVGVHHFLIKTDKKVCIYILIIRRLSSATRFSESYNPVSHGLWQQISTFSNPISFYCRL